MREIIKNVAEVVSNLRILNLVEENNVSAKLEFDEQVNTKLILTVTVVTSVEVTNMCLEMFQKLYCVMSVEEYNMQDPLHSSLTVKFYEK